MLAQGQGNFSKKYLVCSFLGRSLLSRILHQRPTCWAYVVEGNLHGRIEWGRLAYTWVKVFVRSHLQSCKLSLGHWSNSFQPLTCPNSLKSSTPSHDLHQTMIRNSNYCSLSHKHRLLQETKANVKQEEVLIHFRLPNNINNLPVELWWPACLRGKREALSAHTNK